MYDVKGFLERALRQQQNMMKICEKQLKELPKGRLSISRSRGQVYYRKHDEGNRCYLGKCENREVQALQRRKILEEMENRMNENETLILHFLEKYQDPSPAGVQQSLGQAYQNSSLNVFDIRKRKNSGLWGDQPYQRNSLYPEKLTQKTLKGDFVRSKSEVIIANAYFSKGIQYRYEEVIYIGGKTFSPDFSVWVSRLNKVKYHEHFGMMHDPQYREKAIQKIGAYIAAGYRPYEDILFTFDDLDGNFDAQILEQLIDDFMI